MDRCSFGAYMPNLRLATRNAEDHASTKPVAPPYRTPTYTHAHTRACRDLLELQGWSIWGGTWSHWEWREGKLVDVMRAAHSVTNIAHFAFLRFFVWQEDTVKTYRLLKTGCNLSKELGHIRPPNEKPQCLEGLRSQLTVMTFLVSYCINSIVIFCSIIVCILQEHSLQSYLSVLHEQ